MILITMSAIFTSRILRTNSPEGRDDIRFVQGVLAFNHLKTYEEINALLGKKCYERAVDESAFYAQLEMNLLAENLTQDKNGELRRYIIERDAKILERADAVKLPLRNETKTFGECGGGK